MKTLRSLTLTNKEQIELDTAIRQYDSSKKRKYRMPLRDWMLCISVSIATLIATILIMMGVCAVIVDTGRAIVH